MIFYLAFKFISFNFNGVSCKLNGTFFTFILAKSNKTPLSSWYAMPLKTIFSFLSTLYFSILICFFFPYCRFYSSNIFHHFAPQGGCLVLPNMRNGFLITRNLFYHLFLLFQLNAFTVLWGLLNTKILHKVPFTLQFHKNKHFKNNFS